jgi:hypothetical protein
VSAIGPGLIRLPGEHKLWHCPACGDSGRLRWAVTHMHRKDKRVAAILAALGVAVLIALAIGGRL